MADLVLLSQKCFVNGATHFENEIVAIDSAISDLYGQVITEDGDSPQTAAQWTEDNPTLVINVFGRESDTGKAKLGDGTTAWNDLEYLEAVLAADTPTLGDKVNKDLSTYPELVSEDLASVDWTASKFLIQVVTTDEVPVTTLKWVSASVATELITAIQND